MDQAHDAVRPGQPSTRRATMPGILAVVCAPAGIIAACYAFSDGLAGCAFAVAAVALYEWLTRAPPVAAPWFARVAPAFAGVVGLTGDGRDGVGGDRRRSASHS